MSAPLWLTECVGVKKEDKFMAYTIVNAIDKAPVAIMSIVIMCGSTNWFTLNLVIVLNGFVALIVLLFCPESPDWLLRNKGSSEAIVAFNKIAWFNGRNQIEYDQAFIIASDMQLEHQNTSYEGVQISELRRMHTGSSGLKGNSL